MPKAKFISLLSGKGGVGKSVLAFNLADHVADLGFRVLLVDADFGLGSLHVLANVVVEHGLNEYATGTSKLSQVVTAIRGIDLLGATRNHELAETRSIEYTARLMKRLREDSGAYDFVIFDHASGRSDQAVLMAHGSDLNLLLLIPELTSLADGYGLFKQLVSASRDVDCALLINRTRSEEEAEFIRMRLREMTQQFLQITPGYIGFIPEDETVRYAVASQQAISQVAPASPACTQIRSIAQVLVGSEFTQKSASLEAPKTQINKTPATADIRG